MSHYRGNTQIRRYWDCDCLRHCWHDLWICVIIWGNIWMGANIWIILSAAIGSVLECAPLLGEHTNTGGLWLFTPLLGWSLNPCHYMGQHMDIYQCRDHFDCLPISGMSKDPCHYIGNMWVCQCGEFDFSPPLLRSFRKCMPLLSRAFPLSERSMVCSYFAVRWRGRATED